MGRQETVSVAESPLLVPPVPLSTQAPWCLTGEALMMLRDARSVLALVNYYTSPVGPYRELAVGTMMRKGNYFGPSVTQMWVDSAASMREGRAIWVFPKTLHSMLWQRDGQRIAFRAVEAGKVLWWRARTFGPAFPIALHGFCVQELNTRAVKVPVRVSGRARLAWRAQQLALAVEFTMVVEAPHD
ncbi:MAG: hypothetical protein JWN98_1228 [Abditibacteriota bacterium]|nr:hypothetical protein [Abditibacteriota bacterium]